MASPVEAVLLLCDAAVADSAGKVHMLGAGWSQTGSPTAPCAVVAIIKVPWDRANQRLRLSLSLRDSDGGQVSVVTPNGGSDPIRHEGHFEVGRPPGVAVGSPLDSSFVLSMPPLPLAPGRYEWLLTVAEEDFHVAFQVRQ